MQPAFDSWDLAPVPIPARSRLHSIEPIGVGTPFVESLSGYMIRLSASHAVRVSDLIRHELRASSSQFHAPAGISNAINAVCKGAQNWVSTLERFTLQDNLQFLTLLPFASLLNTPGLMRRERAWCPQCYESRRAQGQDVYEQLLWCLQAVEVCPLHGTPLEMLCPSCHRSLRPICAVSRPGFCSRCHRWLGSVQSKSKSPPDYQVWVAREFGNLVATVVRAPAVPRQNIRKILAQYVGSVSEGDWVAIAKTAGCRGSSFYNWYTGRTTARIDLLLRMCHELRIPLPALATGVIPQPETETVRHGVAVQSTRRRNVGPPRTAEQIREALQRAAMEQPAPDIREVAHRLGHSTPCRLYAVDSALCKTISRNFKKSGRKHWWRRRCGKCPDGSVIRKALEDSLALEIPAPVLRIANALGFQTESALMKRFPKLCWAIKSKRATIEQDRRSKITSALRAAICEAPPPALEEVASRLGYASEDSLKAHQPKLCGRLIALRRQIAERSKNMLGERLRAMLKENPPPSLREAHRRLGVTEHFTYGNFPELHRAIAARHREYSRPGQKLAHSQ